MNEPKRVGDSYEYEMTFEELRNLVVKEKQELQAKVLSWYAENGKDEKFAKHFGIVRTRNGKI